MVAFIMTHGLYERRAPAPPSPLLPFLSSLRWLLLLLFREHRLAVKYPSHFVALRLHFTSVLEIPCFIHKSMVKIKCFYCVDLSLHFTSSLNVYVWGPLERAPLSNRVGSERPRRRKPSFIIVTHKYSMVFYTRRSTENGALDV